MENANVSEFIETITYSEAYVLFHEKVYFFDGPSIVNGEDCCRFQVYWFERIAEGRIRAHLVYEVAAQNPVSCINAFFKAKIWEGKAFFDVEQEMRWINDEMDVE
jgi:hypothetical protein